MILFDSQSVATFLYTDLTQKKAQQMRLMTGNFSPA